ncbi:MAG: NAD(P)/FAD-dependent oxidoreductase [Arsenophonus sp.]|nr:MAG: NAD(P)/FAD-dependent oxidoreductase [Arsenophonus sp.]
MSRIKIIIVGGGAGGLELATKLGNNLGKNKIAKITLVDCNASHVWKPLLHEVASGLINDRVKKLSYLLHASQHYFNFHLGKLININKLEKKIVLSECYDSKGRMILSQVELNYDILVLSIGSISNDFNIPNVKKYCMFLNSFREANSIHKELLNLFFSNSNVICNKKEKDKFNIVVVGAGATGVELCSEIYYAISAFNDYKLKSLKTKKINIYLIEASNRILPSLSINISENIHKKLNYLGIKVLTNTLVTSVDIDGLNIQDGSKIKSSLTIWVAGIKCADFLKNISGLETNHINQLIVKKTLQTTLDDSIFAIGDCASCPMNHNNNEFVPPRAQAAYQMADLCYRNIIYFLNKKSLKEYSYKDRGIFISLSEFSTVGNILKFLSFNKNLIIEGRLAKTIYLMLYRIHQINLHGYLKTILIMLVSFFYKLIKPKYKLYD